MTLTVPDCHLSGPSGVLGLRVCAVSAQRSAPSTDNSLHITVIIKGPFGISGFKTVQNRTMRFGGRRPVLKPDGATEPAQVSKLLGSELQVNVLS
jgi:hypothetical protein